jgi:hypothetical protein
MKRRDFVATLLGTTVAGAIGYLGTRGRWSVDEAIAQEEQVLSGVKERIEQHRKGEVTLVVQAPNGKPLPNAELTLTQTRHEFLFGCNIFRWGRIPDPKRENFTASVRLYFQLRHAAFLLGGLRVGAGQTQPRIH